ncbi:hypothetical protein [Microbulbifer agarilyticus]|uniref:hypothetical protein n=1 Tax=Microbulbifer agarilyticus TaxID=260552 RepID=UPI001CD65BF5|nr:hypothetical protein [Microbulbifer agarilyticus]MCA0895055.1 hypothetical protein [Microbulbifer agarilyticus]
MDTRIQTADAGTAAKLASTREHCAPTEGAQLDRYMIVPHGYGEGASGQIWVADFNGPEPAPDVQSGAAVTSELRYWLRVEPADGAAATLARESIRRDVPIVFDRSAPGIAFTLVNLALLPGVHYRLSLWGLHDPSLALAHAECRGRPRTLEDGFNVWYGTCFYGDVDGGALSQAVEALPVAYRPQVSFLGGDQVYLDTAFSNTGWGGSVIRGFSSRNFSPLGFRSPATIRRKLNTVFTAEYLRNWRRGLRTKLQRGFHYFLAGDHEFWNDFPNPPGFLPTLWSRKVRNTWQRCARELFDAYQLPSGAFSSQFDVADALKFFVLDTRLQRARGQDANFTDTQTFAAATTWLRELDRPGVLVLPAPLLTRWQFRDGGLLKSLRVKLGLGDHSLADTGQYQDLVRAIRDCPQDLLILAGDVHFSRLARFDLGGKQVVEVVSSPLACLPSAVAGADQTIAVFPDRPTDHIRAEVEYLQAGSAIGDGSKRAANSCNNNFVTLRFEPGIVDGDVRVQILCWNITGCDAQQAPSVDWEMQDLVLRKRLAATPGTVPPVAPKDPATQTEEISEPC